jgi:hypothetical protein
MCPNNANIVLAKRKRIDGCEEYSWKEKAHALWQNNYWKLQYPCVPKTRQGIMKNRQKNGSCRAPDRHIPSRIG